MNKLTQEQMRKLAEAQNLIGAVSLQINRGLETEENIDNRVYDRMRVAKLDKCYATLNHILNHDESL